MCQVVSRVCGYSRGLSGRGPTSTLIKGYITNIHIYLEHQTINLFVHKAHVLIALFMFCPGMTHNATFKTCKQQNIYHAECGICDSITIHLGQCIGQFSSIVKFSYDVSCMLM